MTLQHLAGSTEYFDFWYEVDPKIDLQGFANGRARALKQTCDQDFRILQQWFEVAGNTDFGPANRIRVNVTDDPTYTQGGLGYNRGYKADGSTTVSVTIYGRPDQRPADDAVRSVWVHEVSEVLMSYRGTLPNVGTAWDPATSDGEGLADTLQGLFYPAGYYRAVSFGPRSPAWWQSPRQAAQDSVTTNDTNNGQANPITTGCAIVFFYYLYAQLGFPFNDIISNYDGSLEATYQALTGKKGGYAALTGLVNRYIPSPTAPPQTDNPFPLGWNYEKVNLTFSQSVQSRFVMAPTPIQQGTAKVRPFFMCSEAEYNYVLVRTHNTLICTAKVSGFGQPGYSWRINGTPVVGAGSITVTASVGKDDPNLPDELQWSDEQVTLSFNDLGDTSTFEGRSASLAVTSSQLGHIALFVEVQVSEASRPFRSGAGGLPPKVSSGNTILDTEELIYLEPFDTDKEKCQSAFAKRFRKFGHIVQYLTHSDPGMSETFRRVQRLENELSQLSEKDPAVAGQIRRLLRGIGNRSSRSRTRERVRSRQRK